MRNTYSVSAVIEEDVQIGKGSFVWYFSHVMSGAKIGQDCTIGEKVFIGKDVIIGDRVKIGNGASICEGAIIKDDVFVGMNAVFTNVRKPVAFRKAEKYLDTIIEERSSIGANATVVGGVRVGKGSMIADGAVVIGNLPDGILAAGNPARIIKKIRYED